MKYDPHLARRTERQELVPFRALPGRGVPPRDQRDLMERPFFSLAKAKRLSPILYKTGDLEVQVHGLPEHGIATIWDADVLIWAASQILAAEDRGLRSSRFFRFTPYQLLTNIRRGTGARNYHLLKGALTRLQSTVVQTTIRNGQQWRRQQFSWINEWEELQTRAGRIEGVEFVLPDWFYRGVLDRRLVLAIDPAYFQLTGGIERLLYRLARKHAGRQPGGWRFELRHLHLKSGSEARFSDFSLDVRAVARRQRLPGYELALEFGRGSPQWLILRPVNQTLPVDISVDNPVGNYRRGSKTIGTSGASTIGTSGAGLSVLRAHEPQLSPWPNGEFPSLKDSKEDSKSLVEENRQSARLLGVEDAS